MADAIEEGQMAAAHGFQIWNVFHIEYFDHNPHVAAGLLGASILAAGAVAYRLKAPALSAATQNDRDFVPNTRYGIRNIFELIAEFVQGTAKDIIGSHYRAYLPLLIFIFMWTLLNNLMGLVPTLGSATSDLNTTLAMGAFVFIYYHVVGVKTTGLHYLEHFTGHLPLKFGLSLLAWLPLVALMFVIEIVSHSVRPITLGFRLRSNIDGDHMVYGIISGLFKNLADAMAENFGIIGRAIGSVIYAIGPVPIVVLGLLICIIQAFVFMLLTTIYIGMATAHDDEH